LRTKDLLIALIVIALVAVICYGLAVSRPPFQPTPSHPFTSSDVGPSLSGHVVMRVNGEPVTDVEFDAAFRQMPDEMRQQFASEPGKMAFAEQIIRLKLLEQEARKLGLANEPKVAGLLSVERMNVLAAAAAEKLMENPSDEAVRSFYAKNKNQFESVDLSHIVIAYAGSMVAPRNGGKPLSEEEALNKAMLIDQQLKHGADFATLARKVSDDKGTADRGGALGPFSPGMLPPEIESKVLALKVGEISEPLTTRYGIHIFKVTARTSAPMEQVRAGISQQIRQEGIFNQVQAMRRAAKVEFDPKFFPSTRPGGKKPS